MPFIDEEGNRSLYYPPVQPQRRLRRAFPRAASRNVGAILRSLMPAPAAGAPQPGTPAYDALIKSDPEYAAWIASRQQREADLATNRAAAIRQLILQYGGLPAGFKDRFGDLRPEDLQAAAGNEYSIEHMLAKKKADAINAMQASLSARGALQSGELAGRQGQIDYESGQEQYKAGQDFLSALAQALGGYTSGVGDVESELPGIVSSVMGRLYEGYKVPPSGTPSAAQQAPSFHMPNLPAGYAPAGRLLRRTVRRRAQQNAPIPNLGRQP